MYYCKDVIPLFHCQIDFEYFYQLTVIQKKKSFLDICVIIPISICAEKMASRLNLQTTWGIKNLHSL